MTEPDKRVTFLKAVRCDMGEDCQDWVPPHHCNVSGFMRVGKKGKCLSFRQNHDYRRRELHELVGTR